MPDLRKYDPEVTARALWLYDRDLCPKLAAALQALNVDDEMDSGESPFDAVDDGYAAPMGAAEED